jgi:superfamily II DNA or RNA helicase
VSDLTPGLYDLLLTDRLATLLSSLNPGDNPDLAELRNAEAADRIALHLASVVERIIDTLPEKERAQLGAQLAARIIEQITREPKAQPLQVERPRLPPKVLRAILGRKPDGSPDRIEQPEIPLLDTTLLTNAPGEPRVQSQIIKEIESADRIDLVMAFIRRSGLYPLREKLTRHVQNGRALRVLTTVYTGSTELEALVLLRDDIGAEVRVSYDTTSSRLHAKSWLFHRDSGFSTAYVGSSNLTHSAQVDGLEWNVRLSAARNRPVLEKIAAVFESYWQQADFEALDEERFRKAIRAERSSDDSIELSPIEVTLRPFQDRLLEEIEMARERGFDRNLLVSATGTGKTVMAAVDYARLRTRLPRARLLFVAHREEILRQSRSTFRHALRDGTFGELWVSGHRPEQFDFVFASIQSLAASGLESLDPQRFDVVIVDEFHHAAAATYRKLLAFLQPKQLLGLTATPERSDGESVLHWFDGRIAAELRLWDAIDQHRLSPFAYFGIADELDLRAIPWRRGAGYDVEGVTQLITGTDVWARKVLQEFRHHVGDVGTTRALGFCVSVDHARYMARVFQAANVKAVAVWADTPDEERKRALDDLAARRVNVVFSVDLFNEGVDVPAVDALLMLRPTDSALLFLQQLGRGLRKAPGKTVCTVLDFVGQHRKEFRYDRRFQALLGGSRAAVADQIERGFPFLPAGCHMELDRVAQQRVLDNITNAVPSKWAGKAQELAKLEQEHPGITLRHFLELSGLDLDDVCDGKRSWSELRELAGLPVAARGSEEEKLRRACGRLTHVDDMDRLDTWSAWLAADRAPQLDALTVRERRLLTMLLAQLFDQVAKKETSIEQGAAMLWEHPQIHAELLAIFDVLRQRLSHLAPALHAMPEVPLRVHARYSRHEILAATGASATLKSKTWREGVLYSREIKADVFVFTLDKTSGQFSPTTRYKDYAITPSLIHWESQTGTSARSETGQRYQHHVARGSHVLLFGRRSAEDRAFHFLGPARYVSHTGELPMAVTWRLEVALPGDLFQGFAAAVA